MVRGGKFAAGKFKKKNDHGRSMHTSEEVVAAPQVELVAMGASFRDELAGFHSRETFGSSQDNFNIPCRNGTNQPFLFTFLCSHHPCSSLASATTAQKPKSLWRKKLVLYSSRVGV